MNKVVNRKNGTLAIEKIKPCRVERRTDMQYLLEEMVELDRQVHAGKRAEIELRKLEEQFRNLCIEEVIEEWTRLKF